MGWTIDPAHTTVGFSVRHMGLSTVRGKFNTFAGEIELDPGDLTRARGTVEIDAASIDTGQPDRDTHLRGADFSMSRSSRRSPSTRRTSPVRAIPSRSPAT